LPPESQGIRYKARERGLFCAWLKALGAFALPVDDGRDELLYQVGTLCLGRDQQGFADAFSIR